MSFPSVTLVKASDDDCRLLKTWGIIAEHVRREDDRQALLRHRLMIERTSVRRWWSRQSGMRSRSYWTVLKFFGGDPQTAHESKFWTFLLLKFSTGGVLESLHKFSPTLQPVRSRLGILSKTISARNRLSRGLSRRDFSTRERGCCRLAGSRRAGSRQAWLDRESFATQRRWRFFDDLLPE